VLTYMKAVVGALIAGLGALATALADDGVEKLEWVFIATATLTALYGVWQVPNKPPDPVLRMADEDARHRDPLH
jgi:hypothetical protein